MNQAPHPRSRIRELGIHPGELTPASLNAITDVPGVMVGQVTLSQGQGADALRTGVTVISPHDGNPFVRKCRAACHTFNGFGKACGLEQIRELGQLETPIGLTNTAGVGMVAHEICAWTFAQTPSARSVNPVVGECNDSTLNNIQAQAIGKEHVTRALEALKAGPVAEGCVGAGCGMTCYGFKGGIGTASRLLSLSGNEYVLGSLVLANFGHRDLLRIGGIPAGRLMKAHTKDYPPPEKPADLGSIMMVLATDAPLSAGQLRRVAKRACLGLARTGGIGGHGSGDFAIAFSTANQIDITEKDDLARASFLASGTKTLDKFFQASVESVEEAVLNALCMAETTTGYKGRTAHALPLDLLRKWAGEIPWA